MGQFKFALWLAYWYLQNEKFEFQWDAGNSTKSKDKHGINIEEVESVFRMKKGITLGHQISPLVLEERLCVIGPDYTDRLLSIVFTLRDGQIRAISSRVAGRKERKFYEKIRKETEDI